jgi:hypothetical protein
MAKVKTVKSFDAKAAGNFVVEWADGVTTTWDITTLSEAVRAQALWHGIKQKTMDAHAGTISNGGTTAEARAASEEVWATLVSGEFNGGRSDTPWIIEALAELFDLSTDDAQAKWTALDDKTRTAVRKDPKVMKWKLERDLGKLDKVVETSTTAGIFGQVISLFGDKNQA